MDREFLGRKIRCSGIDPATQQRINGLWLDSAANAPRDGTPFESAELSITIALRETPTPLHIRNRNAEIGTWGTRHVLVGGDEFWVLESGDAESSAVHGRIEAGGATLELHGAPFTGWLALFSAFGEAMASSGVLHLHAAALHKDGRTLALLGPSGRGKSTSLLRGIAAGWYPIAEDSCWLDVETLRLLPADGPLRLRAGSVELVRALRPDLVAARLDRERVEIPLEQLGERLVASTLTDIVRLERSESTRAEWHPLPATRTVMALHESVGIPHTARVGAMHTRAFASIVRRTTNSTLRMGAISSPFPAAPPIEGAGRSPADAAARYDLR